MIRMIPVAALVMVLLALPRPAGASPSGVDPAFLCAASKQNAIGKKFAAKAKCYAKATRKDIPVDPLCLAKADGKFLMKFQDAEAQGGCATTGDAGTIESNIDAALADLMLSVAPLHGTPCTASPCGTTCGGNGVCAPAHKPGGGTVNECAVNGACTVSSCSLDADCADNEGCFSCPPSGPCCCTLCP